MYQITFREGIFIGTSINGNIQGRTKLNTSEASNRYQHIMQATTKAACPSLIGWETKKIDGIWANSNIQ